MDNAAGIPVELTSWSKSVRSLCWIYRVSNVEQIATALAIAQGQHLSVIPHAAGHSYTDAALNSGGIVIDVTRMHRILSWDPAQGIMKVEPGVTLREVVQMASKDGWWPIVSPSTAEATIGGCVAMNVNGRNAWKCGPFGNYVVSLDVLFPSGEACTLVPEQDTQLLRAFVGSMGLLGFITSITLQLQHFPSGFVTMRRRPATSLDEILALFTEEGPQSDFMEGWLDGFAGGDQLGRGHLTSAVLSNSNRAVHPQSHIPGVPGPLESSLARMVASLGRPALLPGVQLGNRARYWWSKWSPNAVGQELALFPYTYWPSQALAGYDAMFPEGIETFQAFVPAEHAKEIFRQLIHYSQQQACIPIWCVIKQHQRDPFLLSYQVAGFSLELNYQRTNRKAGKLEQVLARMIATVIEAGGRFYLAKDHFMTHAQYRQSVGDQAVENFLRIKRRYDPQTLLQSDLFRRIFQP